MENQIRRARKAAHITQEQLAKLLGINRATLSRYETGEIDLPTSQLQRIADALGISIVELIDPLAVSYHQIIEAGMAGDKAFQRLDEAKRRGASQEELQQIETEINCSYDARDEAVNETHMLKTFRKLNDTGQRVALERMEELTEIPKYQRTEAPAPTPPEDTTPPPEGE